MAQQRMVRGKEMSSAAMSLALILDLRREVGLFVGQAIEYTEGSLVGFIVVLKNRGHQEVSSVATPVQWVRFGNGV